MSVLLKSYSCDDDNVRIELWGEQSKLGSDVMKMIFKRNDNEITFASIYGATSVAMMFDGWIQAARNYEGTFVQVLDLDGRDWSVAYKPELNCFLLRQGNNTVQVDDINEFQNLCRKAHKYMNENYDDSSDDADDDDDDNDDDDDDDDDDDRREFVDQQRKTTVRRRM